MKSERPPSTLVDSMVLLDVFTEDPAWSAWSSEALAAAGDRGDLVLNPIVYAEISLAFDSVEECDAAVPPGDFEREPLPYPAGFLAARAFLAYRRRGGERRSPLPDFYIGAHAAVRGHSLLTREPARYRTYFPSLTLIAPGL